MDGMSKNDTRDVLAFSCVRYFVYRNPVWQDKSTFARAVHSHYIAISA